MLLCCPSRSPFPVPALRLNFQDSEAVVDNFLRLKRRPSSVLQELDKLLTFVTGSPQVASVSARASPASPASAAPLSAASMASVASVASSSLHLWYLQSGISGIGMATTRFRELSHSNCSGFDLSWEFFTVPQRFRMFLYVPVWQLET